MDSYSELLKIQYNDPEAADAFLKGMAMDFDSDDARQAAFEATPFLQTEDAKQMLSFADAYVRTCRMNPDLAAMLKAHFAKTQIA